METRELNKVLKFIEENIRITDQTSIEYLDPKGHLERLDSKQNQIIFGRRGSGKSLLLKSLKESKPGIICLTINDEMKDKIMHMSLPISKETMIMGSDTGGEWSANFKQGNNFSISITADSKEEAYKLYSGLSEGGEITMPIDNTFWGDYFGMFTDKFGINWMVKL